MDNLLEYKEFVEKLSSADDNRVFMNSDMSHASVVLAEMFRRAEKRNDEVCVFAGSLNMDDSVYAKNNYIDAVYRFAKKGGKLRIILNSYVEKKSEIVTTLLEMGQSNVEIRKSRIRLLAGNPNKEVHFTISGNAFRYEYDTDNHSSMCNFNDNEKALKLKGIFEKCWSDNMTIDLDKTWS
jgi:hypothetical protein